MGCSGEKYIPLPLNSHDEITNPAEVAQLI
jgi:hypothetical protein